MKRLALLTLLLLGLGLTVAAQPRSFGLRAGSVMEVSYQHCFGTPHFAEVDLGMDMVLCTGGMSVDPDDRTPAAIRAAGTRVVTYGAPVLPGAMFLLAYWEKDGRNVPVLGLPGCVMYSPATIFDIVLPRLLTGEILTKRELRHLGIGGLCMGCKSCHYPVCGFGK